MPTAREFTVPLEDQPGTIGELCQSLADRGINILAFQAFPSDGKTVFRFLVDSPTAAKTVLDTAGVKYTEAEVVRIALPHRPGELARAASRLGESNININYAYSGPEPGTNVPIVFFGVAEVGRAATILEQLSATAASA
jgi:hypothetical protein